MGKVKIRRLSDNDMSDFKLELHYRELEDIYENTTVDLIRTKENEEKRDIVIKAICQVRDLVAANSEYISKTPKMKNKVDRVVSAYDKILKEEGGECITEASKIISDIRTMVE